MIMQRQRRSEFLTVLRAVLLGDDFTRGLDRPGQQHDHVGRRDVGVRRVLDAFCDGVLRVAHWHGRIK